MKYLIPLLVLPLLAACSSRGGDSEAAPTKAPAPVQADEGPGARCEGDARALLEDHAAVEASFRLLRLEIEQARAAQKQVAAERAELARWYASLFLPAKRAFRAGLKTDSVCFRDDGAGHLTAFNGVTLDREIADTEKFLNSL